MQLRAVMALTGREAAAEEAVDAVAGEEISPQHGLDSADRQFKVDSVSSTKGIQKESNPDDESF